MAPPTATRAFKFVENEHPGPQSCVLFLRPGGDNGDPCGKDVLCAGVGWIAFAEGKGEGGAFLGGTPKKWVGVTEWAQKQARAPALRADLATSDLTEKQAYHPSLEVTVKVKGGKKRLARLALEKAAAEEEANAKFETRAALAYYVTTHRKRTPGYLRCAPLIPG